MTLNWFSIGKVVVATEGTSLDELQNYLQNPTGENAINPQNPFFQQNQMASPSNPWMNPNLPGAFNNPGNLQVNPNLPGATNNPANPEFNPNLPGAQSNPGFTGRNPGLPGSMTNPGNLMMNPHLPGSITNPANPMHGVLPRPDLVGAPPDPMPPGATFAPRPTIASRLNATMTPNQQQRMREQLIEQYGPEQTNVVHTFPDQWTLHHLPTWNEVGREGEMMHHCWAGMEGDEPYPGDKSYMAMSLRDPNGWPHLSFAYSPEDKVPYDFGEHGGYEPDLESPRWQYIQDWMKSQGEHWPLPLDEYDNPSSAKVSANLGWEPGDYDKGLITLFKQSDDAETDLQDYHARDGIAMPGTIPTYSQPLTPTGYAGGSNGSMFAEDPEGRQWLQKTYGGDQNRVASELLANSVYRTMGAEVPHMGQHVNGGIAYPLSPGEIAPFSGQDPARQQALGRHYMTDALLGNWDFAGLDDDNVLWNNNDPTRIDHGGTFEYRAQGEPKPYGPVPEEVWNMRNFGQGKHGVITDDGSMRNQAAQIHQNLPHEVIDHLVDQAPFQDREMQERIRTNLKARRDWMGQYGNGEHMIPVTASVHHAWTPEDQEFPQFQPGGTAYHGGLPVTLNNFDPYDKNWTVTHSNGGNGYAKEGDLFTDPNQQHPEQVHPTGSTVYYQQQPHTVTGYIPGWNHVGGKYNLQAPGVEMAGGNIKPGGNVVAQGNHILTDPNAKYLNQKFGPEDKVFGWGSNTPLEFQKYNPHYETYEYKHPQTGNVEEYYGDSLTQKPYIEPQTCKNCQGTGKAEVTCPTCHGHGTQALTGQQEQLFDTPSNIPGSGGAAPCPTCQGKGVVEGACPYCKGTGNTWQNEQQQAPKALMEPSASQSLCPECHGWGKDATGNTCLQCNGHGSLPQFQADHPNISNNRGYVDPTTGTSAWDTAPYDHRSALEAYQSGSEWVNQPLRGTGNADEDDDYKLRSLDEALTNHPPLQADTRLYRRTPIDHWGYAMGSHDPRDWVGKTIADPGFMSTTVNPENSAVSGSSNQLIIHAPKGTPGFYFPDHGYSEEEWLLPRGGQMQVTGVEPRGGGHAIHTKIVGFDPDEGDRNWGENQGSRYDSVYTFPEAQDVYDYNMYHGEDPYSYAYEDSSANIGDDTEFEHSNPYWNGIANDYLNGGAGSSADEFHQNLKNNYHIPEMAHALGQQFDPEDTEHRKWVENWNSWVPVGQHEIEIPRRDPTEVGEYNEQHENGELPYDISDWNPIAQDYLNYASPGDPTYNQYQHKQYSPDPGKYPGTYDNPSALHDFHEYLQNNAHEGLMNDALLNNMDWGNPTHENALQQWNAGMPYNHIHPPEHHRHIPVHPQQQRWDDLHLWG